ncbi:hypothetical protein [Marinobacter sp. LV10MA510-1]|uniref:hypothetical protein n=1 Tax=Marinobacter sp. LV10MA510-1 TaxID=1415567 RepID=UPI0011806608|nr:hypothetical protein [Marinobacter sp. LV10MA510-1]
MTILRTLTTRVVIAAMPTFAFSQDTTAPNTDLPAVVLEQTTQQFIDSLKGSTPINQLPYEKARHCRALFISTVAVGCSAILPPMKD